MAEKWRIHIRDGKNQWMDDDYAETEADARQQATGWTGQRGQMTWVAVIFSPLGAKFATYRRGKEDA